MWDKIASFILKQRALFLILIIAFTGVMGYYATKVKLEYAMQKLVPSNDADFLAYQKFQKTFGLDNNKVVVGFNSDKLFELKNFRAYYKMCEDMSNIPGVNQVISPTRLFDLRTDTAGKFEIKPAFTHAPTTQAEVDSIRDKFLDMRFYQGMLYNKNTNSALVLLVLDSKTQESEKRVGLIRSIEKTAKEYEDLSGAEMHIGGLPYVRTEMATTVKSEMVLFTVIAFLVTAILILVFFRSLSTLAIAIVFIGIGVLVMFGVCGMLGYKLTLLTGTLPPLLVVIGVQNAIYLINKYHEEYRKHGNKAKALARIISRVGVATFLINFTTAVGFGTFYFTKTQMLELSFQNG
jgi:predicted RND superfamily exporter protein